MKLKTSSEKHLLNIDLIIKELQATYWANERSEIQIRKSLEESFCFAVYDDKEQIAFARVVTDYSTIAYLCDVFVVQKYQGQGVGKLLIGELLKQPNLLGLAWFLRTRDAHGLYEQFDFFRNEQAGRYMERKAKIL